jgi:hypothetical protein
MTPEQVAAWFEESRRAQGLGLKLSDAAHVAIARLLAGVEDQDGGDPPSTRRRRSRTKPPTAALKPTQGADGKC